MGRKFRVVCPQLPGLQLAPNSPRFGNWILGRPQKFVPESGIKIPTALVPLAACGGPAGLASPPTKLNLISK